MPTPTGPVPRDPNDPDLWDWDAGEPRSVTRGRRLQAAIAAVLIVLVVGLILASAW